MGKEAALVLGDDDDDEEEEENRGSRAGGLFASSVCKGNPFSFSPSQPSFTFAVPPLAFGEVSSSSSISCQDPSPQFPSPPFIYQSSSSSSCSSQSSSSSPSSAFTDSVRASPRHGCGLMGVQSHRKIERAPSSPSPSSLFRFAVTGPKDRVYLPPRRMFILQVWAMLEQSFVEFSHTLQLLKTRNEGLVGRTSNSKLDLSERTLRVSVRVDDCTVHPSEDTLTLDDDSALKSTFHEVSVPEEYTQDSLRCVVEIHSMSTSSRTIFSSSFTLGAINREPSGADTLAVTIVHQPSALEIAMQPCTSEIAELLIFASTTSSAPLPALSKEVFEVGLASCWSTKLSFLCGGKLEDLALRFRQHPVRRFLFSGHTIVVDGMKSPTFTSPGGVLSQVSKMDFVVLLGQHCEGRLNEEGNVGALRLVFLNCCHGEKMARAIHEAGVACVVCWRGRVHDEAAQHFACKFFAVDACLSEVRSQSDAPAAFSRMDAHVAFREACKFVESRAFRREMMVLEEPSIAWVPSRRPEWGFQVGVPLMLLRAPNGEAIEIDWNDT
ncbi:hypothetical protein AB1Y20_013664 [Prymnesium parvum]|uniref:CHAT domain-containing protein n=1 Tax=Prymnesium parvum TaxID=97485 RepID=A0AB34IJ76_PRYPA